MKKKYIILLSIFILCVCGCYKSQNKIEDIEHRKAYCYYYKNDTSLSSGYYYIDIETKNKSHITSHYLTNYFAVYATDDFAKNILEGHCIYDGYDAEGNYKVYNKTCEYDNYYHDGFYIVKYDLEEEKDFDSAINELKNKEYECIEIQNQGPNPLINGIWKKSYKIIDESVYESIYIYNFYDDGTFEKTDIINHTYPNPKSDWETPYHETTTKKGFYTFDEDIIYTIIQYGESGIITLKYDEENDTIVEYNKETNLSSSDKYIRYDN